MHLNIENLTKDFGISVGLSSLSLRCENIHALVLIGPSGGGKTTLLRILAGLENPTAGGVEINGRKLIFQEDELKKYRTHIGVVFQSYNLFPHLTAVRNITLPLEKVHGYSRVDAREKAMSLLGRFRLEEHALKKPAELSGGQKQRVAIARALAIDPEVLFLDEPTSALDPEFTAEVLDMILELRRVQKDLILVTHEMGFARKVSDYVVFIDAGKILEEGAPEKLFGSPEHKVVRSFLDKVLLGCDEAEFESLSQ